MSWRDEILWASGLFEGEGSVNNTSLVNGNDRNGRRGKTPRAQARVGMTDEDSVRRFHAAVGFGTVHGPYQGRPRSPGGAMPKPAWVWACQGYEKVQALAALVWDGLGVRRKEQFRSALDATRVYKVRHHPVTGRLLPWTEGALG